MAHFYGTLKGSRGQATRCGTKSSGVRAIAASWAGAIEVEIHHNTETGHDHFEVRQIQWHGNGDYCVLACGVVGQAAK